MKNTYALCSSILIINIIILSKSLHLNNQNREINPYSKSQRKITFLSLSDEDSNTSNAKISEAIVFYYDNSKLSCLIQDSNISSEVKTENQLYSLKAEDVKSFIDLMLECCKELSLDSLKGKTILIAVAPQLEKDQYKEITEQLFSKQSIKRLNLVHRSALIVSAYGELSGVSILIGHEYTHAQAIIQGYTLDHTALKLAVGLNDYDKDKDTKVFIDEDGEGGVDTLVKIIIDKIDVDLKRVIADNIMIEIDLEIEGLKNLVTKSIQKRLPLDYSVHVSVGDNYTVLGANRLLENVSEGYFMDDEDYKKDGKEFIFARAA